MPCLSSCLAASLGTSPNPAATSSTEKCFFPVADATRSIKQRVVATPPNQRLIRQISRNEASISADGHASESRISGWLIRCMVRSVIRPSSHECSRLDGQGCQIDITASMKTLDPTGSKGRACGRDVRALCGILGVLRGQRLSQRSLGIAKSANKYRSAQTSASSSSSNCLLYRSQ